MCGNESQMEPGFHHDVVHQHASAIKYNHAPRNSLYYPQHSFCPWNYIANTWLALVIYLNCCHLHFKHLISVTPYNECKVKAQPLACKCSAFSHFKMPRWSSNEKSSLNWFFKTLVTNHMNLSLDLLTDLFLLFSTELRSELTWGVL